MIGEVKIFAGSVPPEGWALCDGQILNITDYPNIFAVVGKTYGGDGLTTFGLPDLRGRAPIHTGCGLGLTERSLGEAGGTESVVLTAVNLPAHSHAIAVSTTNSTANPTNNFLSMASDSQGSDVNSYANSSDSFLNGATVGTTGGSQPHNNMQPYLAMNYIIALYE